MLKYKAAIQKELDRLEVQANRSFMKLIKDKCKVQHPGSKNNTVWELVVREAALQKQTCSAVCSKQNTSQQR